jgi:hypothetical protein
LVKNVWPYRVDGELGRVEFPTYRVCRQDITLYDTARELFPPLGCWERYETTGFKEIALIRGVPEQSDAKTTIFLNRIRHQEGATGATTLRASAEREGQQVLECLERTTTMILHRESFDETGQPRTPHPLGARAAVILSPDQVTEAIDACGLTEIERADVAQNPVPYEQPGVRVDISIDDVVVKQQKRHRAHSESPDRSPDEEERSGRTDGHTTVAHLQHTEHAYCITGPGGPAVLRMLLGYLFTNALLGSRLPFFVDGQKTLQAAILRAFSGLRNVGMILDWYHVEDKCARQLSLAMKGATLRNEALADLSTLLGYGRVDRAIPFLRNVPKTHLKKPAEIRGLLGYLDRNRPYIPGYEVRKRVGLRNSSNLGEKMTDLLVSHRQKQKGMSWSASGSHAIAALAALKRNGEYPHWFEYHTLELKQAA